MVLSSREFLQDQEFHTTRELKRLNESSGWGGLLVRSMESGRWGYFLVVGRVGLYIIILIYVFQEFYDKVLGEVVI